MFEDLGRIADTLDSVLVEMKQSNELMTKLTNQLKILTLPPNMKAFDKDHWQKVYDTTPDITIFEPYIGDSNV